MTNHHQQATPPEADGLTPTRAELEARSARKIFPFTELARCGDEVWIEYHGKLYRLQSTRQGKLILTK